MKVLCVIPARAGSKSVPDKNIRFLGPKPLLVWSIEAGRQPLDANTMRPVKEYEFRTIVSTDSERYAAIARMAGAETVMRPAELATDEAATDPVIVHALEHVKAGGWRPDVVVLLQPTVPIRRPGLVLDCIERLVQTGADSLLTANRLHFVWKWDHDDNCWYQVQNSDRPRRQDIMRPLYHEDGSVFVSRTDVLEQYGTRLGLYVTVFETEPTVDIDTEDDFKLAHVLTRTHKIQENSAA